MSQVVIPPENRSFTRDGRSLDSIGRACHRLALVAAFLSAAPHLSAQAVVLGSVRQDSTGRPLAGVEVLIEKDKHHTATDESGRYVLSGIHPGSHVVLFRLVGYRPARHSVILTGGDTTRLEPTLVREGVQTLEPIAVTELNKGPRGVGREAFEERRRLGFGRFIDSFELRRSEIRRVSDVLRSIGSMKIVRWQDCSNGPAGRICGPMEERAASGRVVMSAMMKPGESFCWVSVMLDGFFLYRTGTSGTPPDLSKDFFPSDLESMEVYRSASEVPTEFGGTSAACGVLVMWSRRQ